VGTALCGLAQDAGTFLAARLVAGAFGGPATSASFAIIADAIPARLRGRAMGMVMGAFSVAAVLGVPAGLWLAELSTWRAPLFTVAGLGVVIIFFAIGSLPPMRDHLEGAQATTVRLGELLRHPVVSLDELLRGPLAAIRELLRRPLVRLSYLMTATMLTAGFILIPNIAPYLTLNLLMPQEDLKYGYLFGGMASFAATQLGGRLVDRFGSFRVGTTGSSIYLVVVFAAFYLAWTWVPTPVVVVGFVVLMFGMGLRNVSHTTLASKVPEAAVRARFQSLQSAVQHGASSLAAFSSSQLMVTAARPDGKGDMLVGMPRVALVAMGLSLLVPVLLLLVENRVRAQQALAAPAAVPAI